MPFVYVLLCVCCSVCVCVCVDMLMIAFDVCVVLCVCVCVCMLMNVFDMCAVVCVRGHADECLRFVYCCVKCGCIGGLFFYVCVFFFQSLSIQLSLHNITVCRFCLHPSYMPRTQR